MSSAGLRALLLADFERPASVAATCEAPGLSNEHLIDQFRRIVASVVVD